MVEHPKGVQSLLPYLDSTGASFYLKLPLVSEVQKSSHSLRFPFNTVSDSDPLNRLIAVEAMTDAESTLKRVFLLMQRDKYLLINNELLPITNKDIDNFWQTTFSHFLKYQQNNFLFMLANQITERNELVPFQPLFFCKLKQTFFHPPCPKCGIAFQQCYEDELLLGLGLHQYSTSLKRYLYCPNCLDSKGNSDFYVYKRVDSDPPLVKDRLDLIREFDHLLEGGEQSGQLPCEVCGNKEECYGSETQVLIRIVPFSFYPFYMFIFDGMSLQAPDFLALLGGASCEELEVQLANKREHGRLRCLRDLRKERTLEPRFLFSGDERDFLEILYLKLSFLAELAQTIFSGTFIDKRPDLGISLDRIWVKLGHQGGLLPSFWSFRTSPVGLVTKPLHGPAFPNLPSSYGLYILGLCWFYALLINSKQDTSQVYHALGDALGRGLTDDPAWLNKTLMDGHNLSFFPENIFWNPSLRAVHQSHHALWEKALSLGCSLLRASNAIEPDWSKDEFLSQTEDLREEIKKKLFQGEPVAARQIDQSENKAIIHILEGIKQRWLAEVQKTASDLPGTLVPPADDLRAETHPSDVQAVDDSEFIPKTILLSLEDVGRKVSPPSARARELESKTEEPSSAEAPGVPDDLPLDLQARDEKDMIPETVMLSPEKAVGHISTPLEPQPTEDEEPKAEEPSLPETVHLTRDLPLDLQAKDEEDMIPETVMLSSEGAPGHPPESDHLLGTDEVGPNDEESKSRKKKMKDPAEDDFVFETVFLSVDEAEDENDTND